MRAKLAQAAIAVVLAALFGVATISHPPTAAASPIDPAIWVGAPAYSTWPNYDGCPGATFPSEYCSLPSVHHPVYPVSVPYYPWSSVGDWAADIQSMAPGTAVRLYAAPQETWRSIAAQVETVGAACGDYVISHGGYRVTVGLYASGIRVGTVTYAHINPAVSQGMWINPWGTVLGYVGSYTWGSCWKGPHAHTELLSIHHYACYNRDWHPGQAMQPSNFIGFVGGDYASGQHQACP